MTKIVEQYRFLEKKVSVSNDMNTWKIRGVLKKTTNLLGFFISEYMHDFQGSSD